MVYVMSQGGIAALNGGTGVIEQQCNGEGNINQVQVITSSLQGSDYPRETALAPLLFSDDGSGEVLALRFGAFSAVNCITTVVPNLGEEADCEESAGIAVGSSLIWAAESPSGDAGIQDEFLTDAGWVPEWFAGTSSQSCLVTPVESLLVANSPSGFVGLDVVSGALDWVFPDGGSSGGKAWGMAVGQGDTLYFDFVTNVTSALVALPVESASLTLFQPQGSLTNLPGVPVIGKDGTLYVGDQAFTDSEGTTPSQVAAYAPDLTPLWALEVSGSVSTSMAIDCARDPSGNPVGRPGTLYVPTTHPVAGIDQLYAIIVDSHGLDTHAPWPKYQHDPRNTGNAGTDLSEFDCP
jgi:hypothetical protein